MQTLAEELAREKSSAALDPARSIIMELEQIHKEGAIIPIEIKVTFLRDATGQPVGVLGVTRDITERKRAEELIRASLAEKETLLKLISNSLKHAFPADRARPDLDAGQVRIELRADCEGQVTLVVGDNGVGFPPGLDFRDTTSLGLKLVDTLIHQLNGTLELDTKRGTEFRITFVAS